MSENCDIRSGRMIMETETVFDDGEHIIYVNGAIEEKSKIGNLMV